MSLNPAALLKIAGARNKFVKNHPKVSAFLGREFRDIPAGTVLELKVTRPGGETVVTNLRVSEEDLQLVESLRELQS